MSIEYGVFFKENKDVILSIHNLVFYKYRSSSQFEAAVLICVQKVHLIGLLQYSGQ